MTFDDLFAGDSTEAVDRKLDAQKAIGRLTFREATVLYLWAVCEKSQAEIGEIVGLSQQHVSRILADMCKKA